MAKARFQLPACEDDLWHEVVVRLLGQRNAVEQEARDHLRLLEELAFHHRLCGKPLTRAFAEDTATWLAKERDFGSPRDKAKQWLVKLEYWQLLVRWSSGSDADYEFAIPTLDEYFAARHLATRWAEEDESYRAWLPCAEGWWQRGGTFRCPNGYCGAVLPPFYELFGRVDHEETLLLLAGLLREADREECLLDGMLGELNLTLKTLARCRYGHSRLVASVADTLVRTEGSVWDYEEGLGAVGQARVEAVRLTVITTVIAALRERDPDVRVRATVALGRIRNERAVEPLIAALADLDGYIQVSAARALERIGDAAVEPLLASLRHSDTRVRHEVARQLGRMGDLRAVDPLLTALSDPEPRVRSWAIWALEKIGDAQIVEPLRKMLQDRSESVRGAAQRALDAIEHSDDTEAA
jgi:hypothetical protein